MRSGRTDLTHRESKDDAEGVRESCVSPKKKPSNGRYSAQLCEREVKDDGGKGGAVLESQREGKPNKEQGIDVEIQGDGGKPLEEQGGGESQRREEKPQDERGFEDLRGKEKPPGGRGREEDLQMDQKQPRQHGGGGRVEDSEEEEEEEKKDDETPEEREWRRKSLLPLSTERQGSHLGSSLSCPQFPKSMPKEEEAMGGGRCRRSHLPSLASSRYSKSERQRDDVEMG